jgi:hypothetical protein
MPASLHSTEHRGYRELFVAATQLERHWRALAVRVSARDTAAVLSGGARDARALLDELRPLIAARDLYGEPAARLLGAAVAGARNAVGDRFLEVNQALRLAALDVRHVAVLLRYLGAVGEARGEGELVEFCGRWSRRVEARERGLDEALRALAGLPDEAVAPADTARPGRVAHALAVGVGALGEWVDRRAARRARRPGG